MRLAKRLERLEATVRAKNPGRDFYPCCRLIYDPRDWHIDEHEAIAQMANGKLDRLVAAGEIQESERERIEFIVNVIVEPPVRPEPDIANA